MQMTIDDSELALKDRLTQLEDWCATLSVTLDCYASYMQLVNAKLWTNHVMESREVDELVEKTSDLVWRVNHLNVISERNRWGKKR